MSFEIQVKCMCDQCSSIIENEYECYIHCQECEYKLEIEFLKIILEDLYDNNSIDSILNGSDLLGFDSEKEKLIFLKGARYGYIEATFRIQDHGGDDTLHRWEQFEKDFRQKEIKANYDEIQEKDIKIKM